MSAFGGKADMEQTSPHVRLVPLTTDHTVGHSEDGLPAARTLAMSTSSVTQFLLRRDIRWGRKLHRLAQIDA